MAMFLGKISTERKTSPKRISNALPRGVFYENGRYFKLNEKDQKVEVRIVKSDSTFSTFFGLKQEDKQTA